MLSYIVFYVLLVILLLCNMKMHVHFVLSTAKLVVLISYHILMESLVKL